MTDGLRLQLWDDNPSLVDFLGFDAVVAPIVGWRPDFGVNRRAQVLASVGDVTR
jgi:hypothetical protein